MDDMMIHTTPSDVAVNQAIDISLENRLELRKPTPSALIFLKLQF